jgi:hypothetical protein
MVRTRGDLRPLTSEREDKKRTRRGQGIGKRREAAGNMIFGQITGEQETRHLYQENKRQAGGKGAETTWG